MPTSATRFVIIALFVSAALAQPPAEPVNRVLHFAHAETDRVLYETATDIRGITEIPEASVDLAQRTLALRGTAAQIALAEWLVKQWDRSAPAQPPENPAAREYHLASDDIVRVFFVAHAPTPQVLQEVATVVRTISGIRRLFTYNSPNAITARGDASQIALAEWLVNQLDQPANQPSRTQDPHEYRPSGAAADDVVRVFYTVHTTSPRELQEIATDVRSIVDFRRLFTQNQSAALIVRGTAAQMALAEWLVNQLDQPANQPSRTQDPHEYRPSGAAADDVVRVFYTVHTTSPRELQEIATDVRSIVDFRRLFTQNQSAALIVRGTAAQMALAEWLVNQLDQPANQPSRTQDPHEYRPSGAADDVVRVFYTAHTTSPRELQEIATDVRSIVDFRRLFTQNQSAALIVRGTAAQMALAEWLVNQLDQPANQPSRTQDPHEYRPSGAADDVVRVFFLIHTESPQRIQEIATEVRAETEVKRLFVYNAPRALALRGTAAQIALADKLIAERDQ